MTSRFDFSTPIDRRHTGAIKYCRIPAMTGADSEDADIMSMWVADMDFATPPFIIDALRRRLEHPVLGYTDAPADLWPTVMQWIESLHGWSTKAEWYRFVPGIVKGIGMVINCFLAADEKVIIQPPVYHPFRLVPEGNRRQVVMNPLRLNADGRYEMDFENLAEVADEKCRLLILCNPHNPGGVIWDADTLRRLASFCHERGIIVISDEIHSDMALWGRRHVPFASVSHEAAECSVTFGSPSKTFNMAGVVSSYAIVSSERLRKQLFGWMDANEFADPNIFSPIATIAAFTNGAEWRRQMLAQVERNVDLVCDYCAAHMPDIKPYRPEASFLVWLDCRDLGFDHDALQDLFVNKAGLLLNDGEMFGPGGEGHMRLNVGVPYDQVLAALKRLQAALSSCRLVAKPLTIRRYNPIDDRELWDDFVRKEARNATFLHMRDYMDYHSDRFTDHSLIIESDGRTIALLPGCALADGTFSSHAGLTYGGMLMSQDMTQQMAVDAFSEINTVLRAEGFTRVVYKPVPHIYHRIPAEEDLYALFREGTSLTLQGRSPSASVMMVDRLDFTGRRRKGVKKAMARGVKIVENTDFGDFWEILSDNLEHRHGSAPVHTLSEIELLHSRFPENIRLFEARGADGSALAGCVIYDCGTVWHTQYISASEAGRECAALDLLLSTLLDKCPARYFDFGTSTEHGGLYLNAGLIHQKEGFGGRAVAYDTWAYSLL